MRRRIVVSLTLAAMMAMGLSPADAERGERRSRPNNCGSKFVNGDECAFKYRGGQLFVTGSIRGFANEPAGGTVRLEARNRASGTRYLLLSCTYAGGSCSSGGRVADIDDLKRGQKLFCSVDGVGRGVYKCGAISKRK